MAALHYGNKYKWLVPFDTCRDITGQIALRLTPARYSGAGHFFILQKQIWEFCEAQAKEKLKTSLMETNVRPTCSAWSPLSF